MRYPDSLQRQEGFRSPSRRLVCVNSAIHTGHPPLGFACPEGKLLAPSWTQRKSEQSPLFTLKSASLVAVASHISQLKKDSNTGLKLYKISEELRGPIEPILLECKFIGGNQYLVAFVPKILLSQLLHASALNCSKPLHSLNSKKNMSSICCQLSTLLYTHLY